MRAPIDIRRRAEIYLCQQLTALVQFQLPGHQFLPMTGFGESETDLEPPFTVVNIVTAECMFHTGNIWQCAGSIQFITHSDEATSEAHSALFDGITNIVRGLIPDNSDPDFIFSGIDIVKTRTADNADQQAHADILDFTLGCQG